MSELAGAGPQTSVHCDARSNVSEFGFVSAENQCENNEVLD